MTSFPLADLPLDLVHVISKHLSLLSVLALTLTCKSFHQLISMNEETFWRQSLTITCPLVKFPTGNSAWGKLAQKQSRCVCLVVTYYQIQITNFYVRLQKNWMVGKTSSRTVQARSSKWMDENWALLCQNFSQLALFNCHTEELVLSPHILELGQYTCLNSQPDSLPFIVGYRRNNAEIQLYPADEKMIRQKLPFKVQYDIVGVDNNKIYLSKSNIYNESWFNS